MSIRRFFADDFKEVRRHWSTWFSGAGVMLMSGATMLKEAWVYLPPGLQATLPWAPQIAWLLFLMAFASKFIKQPRKTDG